jgi:hypothetical protein
MIPIWFFVIAVIGAGALYWVYQKDTPESFCRCRCPNCAQKVRYPVCQAGRTARCGRCKQLWVLPDTSTETSAAEQALPGTLAGSRRAAYSGSRFRA